MIPTPKKCPFCQGDLLVTSIRCHNCHTHIKNDFIMSDNYIPNIDTEILNFIKIFIATEGNMSQAAKKLNCSYPKIKNLLKKTKEALGIVDNPDTKESIESIINDLSQKEIDFQEALKKINNL